MLAVKTSDQEEASQRVPFGFKNFWPYNACEEFGGGSFLGTLNSKHWFKMGLCDKFFILCKTMKQRWSRF